jgi:hypothetical protein
MASATEMYLPLTDELGLFKVYFENFFLWRKVHV